MYHNDSISFALKEMRSYSNIYFPLVTAQFVQK